MKPRTKDRILMGVLLLVIFLLLIVGTDIARRRLDGQTRWAECTLPHSEAAERALQVDDLNGARAELKLALDCGEPP
jgi:hypothetical protein